VSDRDRLYLNHILAAIADAAEFPATGRDDFIRDRRTQSAVIRRLEIIGEAVKRLSAELTAAEPGIPWRLIAGARDRLIHGYFSVDLDAVWAMVEQDLPPLEARLQRILKQQAGG
jgi:uncharacterized protein with HEPN domain